MKALENINKGKKYADQIKPFNFLLSCHVKAFGNPLHTDPEHFHLISPYDANPKNWLKKERINEYDKEGKTYGIRTWGHSGDRNFARVKTYGEVIQEYEFHPEAKCADANGKPCEKHTTGFLQRRHVRIDQFKFIGKESNSLENVESGLEHSEQNVYTEYVDPKRDEWTTKIFPALRKARLKVLVQECGRKFSRSGLIKLQAGGIKTKPHRKTQQLLLAILKGLGCI
jgi:hypothetical protein